MISDDLDEVCTLLGLFVFVSLVIHCVAVLPDIYTAHLRDCL